LAPLAIEETLANRGGAIDEKLGQRNKGGALFDRLQAASRNARDKPARSAIDARKPRRESKTRWQRGRALPETWSAASLKSQGAREAGARSRKARERQSAEIEARRCKGGQKS
jgi:hypothetical protein